MTGDAVASVRVEKMQAEQAPAPHACAALTRLLDELASVLLDIGPCVYTASPMPGVSGTIGEHVRHIIDHVTVFAAASAWAPITYDHRERGGSIEVEPIEALRAIARLETSLAAVRDEELDLPLSVSAIVSRGQRPLLMKSTRRRELVFVVHHTIHHQALIAMLLAIAGEPVPAGFGRAPTSPLCHVDPVAERVAS